MTGINTMRCNICARNEILGIPLARNASDIKYEIAVTRDELNAHDPSTIPANFH